MATPRPEVRLENPSTGKSETLTVGQTWEIAPGVKVRVAGISVRTQFGTGQAQPKLPVR